MEKYSGHRILFADNVFYLFFPSMYFHQKAVPPQEGDNQSPQQPRHLSISCIPLETIQGPGNSNSQCSSTNPASHFNIVVSLKFQNQLTEFVLSLGHT